MTGDPVEIVVGDDDDGGARPRCATRLRSRVKPSFTAA
jgi:hypothetical protein